MTRALMGAAASLLALVVVSAAAPPVRMILDTDFVAPPYDDGLALLFALASPELDLVAVTTVAGNETVEKATADALRVLEIAGRADIPVYRGASRPLKHRPRHYQADRHGRWWTTGLSSPPPGGFAATGPARERAAEFLVRATRAEPGRLTIVAVGPLTNLAEAIRRDPQFPQRVKQLIVMGGAIAQWPDGAGNVTPNAEFNVWVDPEAAHAVLHSGMPLVLSPLNVARKVRLTRKGYEALVRPDTPVARLLRERLGPLFESDPDRAIGLYDPVAVASLVDPTLVKTTDLYVEIDTHPGPSYGVTVGGGEPWPGGEHARKIPVHSDLDGERFMQLFIQRTARGQGKLPGTAVSDHPSLGNVLSAERLSARGGE